MQKWNKILVFAALFLSLAAVVLAILATIYFPEVAIYVPEPNTYYYWRGMRRLSKPGPFVLMVFGFVAMLAWLVNLVALCRKRTDECFGKNQCFLVLFSFGMIELIDKCIPMPPALYASLLGVLVAYIAVSCLLYVRIQKKTPALQPVHAPPTGRRKNLALALSIGTMAATLCGLAASILCVVSFPGREWDLPVFSQENWKPVWILLAGSVFVFLWLGNLRALRRGTAERWMLGNNGAILASAFLVLDFLNQCGIVSSSVYQILLIGLGIYALGILLFLMRWSMRRDRERRRNHPEDVQEDNFWRKWRRW